MRIVSPAPPQLMTTLLRHAHSSMKPRVVCPIPAALLVALACGDSAAPGIRLDDLTDPDTNAAVVVLDTTVQARGARFEAGREYVYRVRTDRVPHTLLAEWVSGTDSATVTFVITELYAAGPVVTDGVGNAFTWRDPLGRTWQPATSCTLNVTEAYVFGTPSTQAIETACRVRSPTGETLTVFAKARRFATLGG